MVSGTTVIVLHRNVGILGRCVCDQNPQKRTDQRSRSLSVRQPGCCLPLLDIGLRHLHDGREFEHDLQHRAGHHVDLVVSSRVAAIVHLELFQVGLYPEDVLYFPTPGGELRILARPENQHGALGSLLRTLDPDLNGAGELALADQLDETGKFWVGWSLEPVRPVVQAVNRIQHDRHDAVRRISRLEHEQHGTRRNRRHQPLQEIDTGERLINHRRTIGVSAGGCGAAGRGKGADDGRVEVARAKVGAKRALELIAGDHLRDLEKDRHIRVAELDDVEEGLLLPGIADRAPIVDPVVRYRSRTDAAACSERASQSRDSKYSAHGYVASSRRTPIALTSGLAVTPWATTLSSTVQPAASIIVSLPGSFSSRTRMAKTIVASPRGPNQPMNSLSAVLVRVPIRHRKTGSIRMTVKLRTA